MKMGDIYETLQELIWLDGWPCKIGFCTELGVWVPKTAEISWSKGFSLDCWKARSKERYALKKIALCLKC